MRTHFSGIGAPEEAMGMILAACKEFKSTLNVQCLSHEDKNAGCQSYLQKRRHSLLKHDAGVHSFGDILSWLSKTSRAEVAEAENTMSEPFDKVKSIIMRATLLPSAPCGLHKLCLCGRAAAGVCDLDVSGTPCIDHSQMGNMMHEHGPTGKLLALWCRLALQDRVKIIIHENVMGFTWKRLLEFFIADDYWHFAILSEPDQIGSRCSGRERRYDIFIRKADCELLFDPSHLFKTMSAALGAQATVDFADLMCEVDLEALQLEKRLFSSKESKMASAVAEYVDDWKHLLAPGEQKNREAPT